MPGKFPKTALLAWELGEGLGHLPTLKAIGGALRDDGWRIAFALREPEPARAGLATLACPVLQAPFWPDAAVVAEPSYSYADILAANGFAASRDLRSLIDGWDSVFDATKPDLVVCEHSPGAVVAAFGRIPVALVGNGFLMPPADGTTFPSYMPAKSDGRSQQAILAAMREALAPRGAIPQTITEPFRGAFRGVYTFPALDPYRALRRDQVFGPLETLPPLTPLPAKRHVFAYSASDAALIDELSAVLMDSGAQASAYFRGRLGARGAVLQSRGVRVFSEAPALAEILPGTSCVFSHAGSGLTAAAFAAGRPQILAPRHGEADATAKLLEDLGVGITVAPMERKRLREAIERVHSEPQFAAAAQRAGEAAQAFVERANGLARTVATFAAL